MTELILTRGYPASGKTTLAREWVEIDAENRVRVNRDDLRHNLFGKYIGLTYKQEQAVTAAQHASVEALLKAGKSVVVDDTNLRLRYARAYVDLAVKLGVEFHVVDLMTDAARCKTNDLRRSIDGGRLVGASAIDDIAKRFPMPWPEVKASETVELSVKPYYPNHDLPAAIIVDIDGTVADMGDRNPYDFSRVGEDVAITVVLEAVYGLSYAYDAKVIYMSGRDDSCREDTEAWLRTFAGPYAELHMRKTEEHRGIRDSIVKAELFDEHVRDRFNVVAVFDDRQQVVDMWRDQLGIQTFQCAKGDF